MREIALLANIDGIAALREAAKMCHVSYWDVAFKANSSAYLQAIYAWSMHRDVFEKAKEILRTNRSVFTRKRTGLPIGEAPFSEEKIRELKHALQSFLLEKDHCGKVCTVDVVERDNGKFSVVAYPDGHAVPKLYHDEEENLRPRMDVSVFEILFGVDTEAGTLELSTHLAKGLKQELEDLFIRTVYGIEPPPIEVPKYDLQLLKNPKLVLITETRHCLSAEVSYLNVKFPGIKSTSAFGADDEGTFVRPIAHLLGREPQELVDATVRNAKIRFHFHPMPGRRAGTLCAEFTSPSNLVIRCRDLQRVEIMLYYLKKWGVAQ